MAKYNLYYESLYMEATKYLIYSNLTYFIVRFLSFLHFKLQKAEENKTIMLRKVTGEKILILKIWQHKQT